MAKINVLGSSVYNIIAAGEVVERPRSIVKELVENAIDAGASYITVSITDGGKTMIEITDNGCGIDKDYVTTAFLPHSTSKVKTADDLQSISTLGFRGEALASIASVSKIEMITQSINDTIGSKIIIECGTVVSVTPINRANGVTITVTDLFINTPARLKFMRSSRSEQQEITHAVGDLILSNPDIAIEYRANGELIYLSSGRGLADAIFSIYGKATCDRLIPVDKIIGSYIVRGYVSHPELTKANRSYQTTILNGRIITNSSVSSAVSRAYENAVMKRAFPIFVLDIIMPFGEVDVNVHPNKADVRFVDNNTVFKYIYAAVRDALSTHLSVFSLSSTLKNSLTENTSPNINGFTANMTNTEPLIADTNSNSAIDLSQFASNNIAATKANSEPIIANANSNNTIDLSRFASNNIAATEANSEPIIADTNSNNTIDLSQFKNIALDKLTAFNHSDSYLMNDVHLGISSNLQSSNAITSTQNKDIIYNNNMLNVEINTDCNYSQVVQHAANNTDNVGTHTDINSPTTNIQQNDFLDTSSSHNVDLVVLSQIFDTYLLVKKGSLVYLIDQHAAHERLIYDRLVADIDNQTIQSQPLLIPQIITLSAMDHDYIMSITADLANIGLDIGEFGTNTIKISACPAVIASFKLSTFIDGLLRNKNKFTSIKLKDVLRSKLIIEACKAAIKAGDKLNNYQIDGLLSQMQDNMPLQCPHGRPAIIAIERKDIDKIFKRIL